MKHIEDNGCEVRFLKREEVGGDSLGSVLIFECVTHAVEICRCGIAWGGHSDYYEELEAKKKKTCVT